MKYMGDSNTVGAKVFWYQFKIFGLNRYTRQINSSNFSRKLPLEWQNILTLWGYISVYANALNISCGPPKGRLRETLLTLCDIWIKKCFSKEFDNKPENPFKKFKVLFIKCVFASSISIVLSKVLPKIYPTPSPLPPPETS